MKYYFTDPFTGKPLTTAEEVWKFCDDNRGKFQTFSSEQMRQRWLDRIAELKAKKAQSDNNPDTSNQNKEQSSPVPE